MIKVLIADDSAFMRMVLSDLFKKQPDFEIVGTATDGKDAVDKVKRFRPNLVTMDINMPIMDGLQALEIIMRECPTPVVMVSSLTKEGAEETIQALNLGAVDFISKTGGSVSKIDTIESEILEKCRAAATARIGGARRPGATIVRKPTVSAATKRIIEPPKMKRIALPIRRGGATAPAPARPTRLPARATTPAAPTIEELAKSSGGSDKIVVLGTSTGGPKALQTVIPMLPKDLPCGVLVVQHMPPGFTKSLAERLNEISQISVKEAANRDIITPGQVYIAPGNYHMVVTRSGRGREIQLNQDPPIGTLRPAADVLFKSATAFGASVVSVILTGMGCDGAEGMKLIKNRGGYIIAESESTCVVYGMPKAVVDQGIADEILPLPEVAAAIVSAVCR